jgi:hypothetical protein
MAKSKSEVVAFNAGELGKEALARVDLQNYARGAEIMENIFPLRQGGMTKAPGTIFVGETPDSAVALLRPWVTSDVARFALEISGSKIRFVVDGGYVTLEGAAATVGSWTDESAVIPSGGGTAPDGGTGDIGGGSEGGSGGFGGGFFDGGLGGFSGLGGGYIP